MIRKITFLLSICILSAILSACGGQDKRAADIPTEQEALAAAENEFGIRGAKVLNVRDVRNEGSEYYGIDAIYTMASDRIREFTILRTWTYDALFWGGYYYSWITDYSDLVCDDYVKDHPLPEGIVYSVSPYARSDYGAKNYFQEENKQIWFDFDSDEVFEERLDALEPWLDEWLSYERQYLTQGKDPHVQVVAHRAQDNTMNFSIQLYRTFGYEKDSFHTAGEDGETYRWDSFQKAMRAGYLAKKKLVMK
ncbi:MAG: hypothetical protein K6E16_04760 [Lachnospiraceae bacterium]|nr:hypothetical protein [Lachnospiraceae bacterium]